MGSTHLGSAGISAKAMSGKDTRQRDGRLETRFVPTHPVENVQSASEFPKADCAQPVGVGFRRVIARV
jgi:hypothetical protein